MQWTEYMIFNSTNCTINNKYSFVIYGVPPACFDLYKSIIRGYIQRDTDTANSFEYMHV